MRIGAQLLAFLALVIGVPGEPGGVELLDQDDARTGLAVRIDRCHAHRVRFIDLRMHGFVKPLAELGDRIVQHIVFRQTGAAVIEAQIGQHHAIGHRIGHGDLLLFRHLTLWQGGRIPRRTCMALPSCAICSGLNRRLAMGAMFASSLAMWAV
jgi:hypothetical protein